MDYDDIASYFLIPPAIATPQPQVPDTLARRLRDAMEAIATIGWWSRSASESAAKVGLDFFSAYVWGRAASLGADVSSSVVEACFGVFEVGTIQLALTYARSTVSQEGILGSRQTGATGGLATATSSIDTTLIETLGSRLLKALWEINGTGRPLFSGLRSLPVPADPHGALCRGAELIREHRGDGHLAACISAGLNAREMNVLTEVWLGYPFGEYSSTRGFSEEQLAQTATGLERRGWLTPGRSLTKAGHTERAAIEFATDVSQDTLIEELGDDVEWVISSANSISSAILAARAAPADPRKRAAG